MTKMTSDFIEIIENTEITPEDVERVKKKIVKELCKKE